ncbi:MAG: hypothetical protein MUO50_10590, partial [Longimicrobiales bacterium]|nr:hypothetical protein [Longimicrobiales bacterium]
HGLALNGKSEEVPAIEGHGCIRGISPYGAKRPCLRADINPVKGSFLILARIVVPVLHLSLIREGRNDLSRHRLSQQRPQAE